MSTTWIQSPREVGSLFLDFNSAARNTASTIGGLTSTVSQVGVAIFTAVSSVAAGVVGVPGGGLIAKDGYRQTKEAVKDGDVPRALHNTLWTGMGATYAGLSGILGASGIMSLANLPVPSAFTPVFGYLGLAMYGMLFGYGAYGLKQASTFQSDLENKVKTGGQTQALEWLRDQILLTEDEKKEIQMCPAHEKERVLRKKFNQFALRTNAECAAEVFKNIEHVIQSGDSQQAECLILQVKEASFKAKVKYILFIVIALLGIAASIFVLLTMAHAVSILFAVGAVTWLTVDSSRLHNYIGDKCWTGFHAEEAQKLRSLKVHPMSTAAIA